MIRRPGRWERAAWCRAAIIAAAAAAGGVSSAQVIESLPLARTYGSGVHAYFGGDYDRSYDDLTAAIEAGSQDPRARYYRGLAALRLGRLDEAEADFAAGSDLEARATGGWAVSRSLERVQGCDRLRLERHRTRARVAALQLEREAERERYSDTLDAQDDVRRRWRPAEIPPASGSTVRNLFEGETRPATLPEPGPAATEQVLPAPTDAVAPAEGPMDVGPSLDALAPQPEMELPPAEADAPLDEAPLEDPVPPADGNPFGADDVPPADPVEADGPPAAQ